MRTTSVQEEEPLRTVELYLKIIRYILLQEKLLRTVELYLKIKQQHKRATRPAAPLPCDAEQPRATEAALDGTVEGAMEGMPGSVAEGAMEGTEAAGSAAARPPGLSGGAELDLKVEATALSEDALQRLMGEGISFDAFYLTMALDEVDMERRQARDSYSSRHGSCNRSCYRPYLIRVDVEWRRGDCSCS